MKKLRLLLFEECNRKCPGCCNNDWDLSSLERETDYAQYEEILLTGGEPMLNPALVVTIALNIRRVSKAKIYMYTAKVDKVGAVLGVLFYIDGLTLTLHTQRDVGDFVRLNNVLGHGEIRKNFKLNVFKGVDIGTVDTSIWNVKSEFEWIKNCPLPTGEVFKRPYYPIPKE